MLACRKKARRSVILTPRRMQIISLVTDQKMGVSSVAKHLGIDFYTVRDHVRVLRLAGILSDGAPDGGRTTDRRRLRPGRQVKLPV